MWLMFLSDDTLLRLAQVHTLPSPRKYDLKEIHHWMLSDRQCLELLEGASEPNPFKFEKDLITVWSQQDFDVFSKYIAERALPFFVNRIYLKFKVCRFAQRL
jgi:hypothetical protein